MITIGAHIVMYNIVSVDSLSLTVARFNPRKANFNVVMSLTRACGMFGTIGMLRRTILYQSPLLILFDNVHNI